MLPERFHIQRHQVGRRIVLAVYGEVDIATAPRLGEAIGASTDCGELWVDLSEVSFLDSTGLSVLVAAQTSHRVAHTPFAVICPQGPVRRVLEISGVERHLDVFTDRSAANSGS